MLRFCLPIAVIGGVTALVACSERDPVADNVAAARPAEVDVLPPDESAATPTDQLEEGAADPVNMPSTNRIPASLHGRWGLTPGDCTSTRGDAKGLLVISSDSLKFYESVARPVGTLKTSRDSASGEFAFTGEGMTWKKYEALELEDGKLVRTQSDPMASYTYARCTS